MPDNVKIVAFLQNQWFKDPERVKRLIAQHGDEYRRRLITYALFLGCKTGRVLRSVFGDLCDEVLWEESSKEISGNPSEVFPPDLIHIKSVLVMEEPDIVIAFGKIACQAVQPLVEAERYIAAPHPAARGELILPLLRGAKVLLEQKIKETLEKTNARQQTSPRR
jgi:hypothetical protein